jgi:hypothetical protein
MTLFVSIESMDDMSPTGPGATSVSQVSGFSNSIRFCRFLLCRQLYSQNAITKGIKVVCEMASEDSDLSVSFPPPNCNGIWTTLRDSDTRFFTSDLFHTTIKAFLICKETRRF